MSVCVCGGAFDKTPGVSELNQKTQIWTPPLQFTNYVAWVSGFGSLSFSFLIGEMGIILPDQ